MWFMRDKFVVSQACQKRSCGRMCDLVQHKRALSGHVKRLDVKEPLMPYFEIIFFDEINVSTQVRG